MDTADEVIRQLGLQPHPEGGWYRETWREPSPSDDRALATGIHFLLKTGERSHWHRVDAAEMWIYNAGGPLLLRGAEGAHGEIGLPDTILGPDLAGGHEMQHLYLPHAWQSAEPLGEWTLVTCIVTPGFDFSGFELAPPGWEPLVLR
ncbi:cupin domain-containing protein [Croceicoccus sediminis]|uniref:cupin domain-containing protein n=1 Tax=Croceicoccus sediminis TaxID=2571150 RepID=UPI001181FD31|nr:cupin domain-containing protein [Croceicoccus sediminis]